MKFGMFSFFGYELPLAERLRLIRDAGFDFTALWWGEEEPEVRAGRKLEIARLARDIGIAVDNIHLPIGGCNRLWSRNAAELETWAGDHIGLIEDCSRSGVGMAVMHLTHGRDTLPPGDEGLEAFARVLSRAEALGVQLAVENTRGELHLDRLFERFDSPFLGLCYDSSHARVVSAEPLSVLRRHGKRLITTHLSDNDGEADRHWPPGEGVLDWTALAADPSFERLGAVMLEVMGPREKPWPAPQEFLSLMRGRIRAIFGR